MIIQCPQCEKKALLNEELYKEKILKIRCKECKHIWMWEWIEEKKEAPVIPPPKPPVMKPPDVKPPEHPSAEVLEAQKIARLIISEIKLYNQDLLHKLKRKNEVLEKLKEDLSLGKQHYKQRISQKLPPLPDYFDDALHSILLSDKE